MSIQDLCKQLTSDSNEVISQVLIGLTKRTRNAADISDLYDCNGYAHLYNLIKSPCDRFTSPVLSVFANCTNVSERWRNTLRDGGGVQMIVDILQGTSDTGTLCRCARLIANLAKDSASLTTLQDKFIIETLVNNSSLENIKCQMACLRAIRIICTSRKSAKMAVDCKKFPDLLILLSSSECDELILLCLRMLCELLKTRIPEVCHRIMECEILSKLLEFCKHIKDDIQNISYEILFLLSLNSGCRVAVAMEGALEIFVERIQTLDSFESFKFAVQSICLCAREAVSRNKMKTVGTLPCLVKILNDDDLVSFHEAIVAAFVMFIFDDLSLGIMIRAGVIPAILKYLDRLTGIEFNRIKEHGTSEVVLPQNTCNQSDIPVEMDAVNKIQPSEATPEVLISTTIRNEDVYAYERQQCWSTSSPETSPYHAGSPPYFVPPGYSPPHSPHLSQPSYSPPHSPYSASPPQYSPQHSPVSQGSPPYSPPHPSILQSSPHYSPQHSPLPYVPPCYSPQHSPQSHNKVIENDHYSDPLNDSSCSSEQVPYHHQSADGLYAMIHGTRGPVHDTLLLLSRFSQATDPSSFFLVLPEFNHLLNYLLLSYTPKPKCARILNRLTQNSHCFDIMLKEKLIPRLYLRLCTGWSLEHIVKLFDAANDQRNSMQVGVEDQDEKMLADNLCKWKSPSQETLSLGRLLVSNIRSQCDSSYGKGVLSHILLSGSKLLKEKVVVSLPHIVRSIRLKRRVFWELKAAHLLMDMMSLFPNIDSEMFVLNVEAICALSHLIGFSCEKLPDLERTACMKVDEGTDVEPPSKRRKLNGIEVLEESKVVLFKLPSGKILPCDSKYLVNHSRVFERMLSRAYIDSTRTYIDISDINENAFSKLIHFLCGCEIRLDGSLSCEGVCLHQLKYRNVTLKRDSDQSEVVTMNLCQQSARSHDKHDASTTDKSNENLVKSKIEFNVQKGEDTCEKTTSNLDSEDVSLSKSPHIKKDGGNIDIHNLPMQLEPSLMSGMDLLGCSERFFVEELKSKCENLLMNSTSDNNVVDLFFLSSLHNSFLLKKHTFTYLLTSIDCPMLRTKCFAEILYSNEKESFLEYLRSEFIRCLHRQET